MRYFRVIYQKTECRDVWVETTDETMTERGAEKLFLKDFTKYDGESDEHDCDSGSLDVLSVDEIDEEGNDI